MSRKRRAAARVRPVSRATSVSVSCGSLGAEGADHGEPALQRLDEVGARTARGVLGRLSLRRRSSTRASTCCATANGRLAAGHAGVDRGVDQHLADLLAV